MYKLARANFSMQSDRAKRTAHEFVLLSNRPMISAGGKSKIPLIIRQGALDKFFDLFKCSMSKEDAIKRSFDVETQLYEASKQKVDYKLKFTARLLALRKDPTDDETAKTPNKLAGFQNLAMLKYDEVASRLDEFLATPAELQELSFPSRSQPYNVELMTAQEYDCCRCRKPFIPDTYYKSTNAETCQYHYGKLLSSKGHASKLYTCCHGEASSIPCTHGSRHVYFRKDIFKGQKVYSSLEWSSSSSYPSSQHYPILAIDGEMCHTESGLEICRLTAVDWDEKRVLDILISPESPFIDYNTRFSGLTEECFKPGGFLTGIAPVELQVFTLGKVMTEVLPLIMGPETILVGHSLENDLLRLRLEHSRIIDTSILYPHNKGPPFRKALRDLTRVHLQQFVQEGSEGHDSYEDCVACLRLLKIKL